MPKGVLMLAALLCFAVAPCACIGATDPIWDILNETYGNGVGQYSFTAKYAWPWSDTPSQTLNPGYARLTCGSGNDYAVRTNGSIGMPSNGTWRIDITMKLDNAMGATLYLSDNKSPRWGTIVQINNLYSETAAHPNTIGDYNKRLVNGGNIAPSGFDGSAIHIYSFRMTGGVCTMYVDNVSIGAVTSGAGAQGDACELEIGLGAGLSTGPGTANIYSVKIASALYGTPAAPETTVCCYDLTNMPDLSRFCQHWLESDCVGPDWCNWTDYDQSQKVDFIDYAGLLAAQEPVNLIENGQSKVFVVNMGEPEDVELNAAEMLRDAFATATGVRPQSYPIGLKAPTTHEGSTNLYGSDYTTTNWYLVAGNDDMGAYAYYAIIKFPLSGVTGPVQKAMLKLWPYMVKTGNYGGSSVYVRLQHYTYNNTGAVSHTDCTVSYVENVGNVIAIPVSTEGGSPVIWDITTQVNNDISAGRTYTGYRIKPCDPSGSNLSNVPGTWGGYGAEFYSQDDWSVYSNWIDAKQALYPRINLEYAPTSAVRAGMHELRIGKISTFSKGISSSLDQAYVIRRVGTDIEIPANSARAVLWGALDFCGQELHVSWPAYDCNAMREGDLQTTLSVGNLCELPKSDFSYRGWDIGLAVDGPNYDKKVVEWMGKNRCTDKSCTQAQHVNLVKNALTYRGLEADSTVHSFWWLIPCDEYFATHPEYFPLINGTRQCGSSNSVGYQICVSNPNVVAIITQKARDFFTAYPKEKIFGVAPNDDDNGEGWCQDANCIAWDGAQAGTNVYSNRLIRLVNAVANNIAAEFPDKYIGTYAYHTSRKAPDIAIAPNVIIGFTTTGRNYMRKLTDATDSRNAAVMSDLSGWLIKGAKVWLYEYYYFSGNEYCPSPIARTLCDEYAELRDMGLTGVSSEITYFTYWPFIRLPMYAHTLGMRHADTTYDEMLTDYCSTMYGPAASAMKSYHLLYETTLRSQIPVLTCSGAGLQLFPAALGGQIPALQGYLNDANTAAQASGNVQHYANVRSELANWNTFKSIMLDPATIIGIGSNLVTNAGAESSATGWISQSLVGSYSLSTPTSSGHTGSRSFKIQCAATGGKGRWLQDPITITPGKKYAARVWVKASGASYGRIALYQASGEYDVYVGWESSNGQWVQIVVPEFTAVKSSMGIYLEMYGMAAGDTVYFDDVFIGQLP